ncbi:MAG: hypothetical protein ACRDRK_08120, partial [Pseudonocardia sp.]
GHVPPATLRRVQVRRWGPTALIQAAQRLAHRAILGKALAGAPAPGSGPERTVRSSTTPSGFSGGGPAPEATGDLPRPVRLIQRFSRLQAIPARVVAIGPLPEHAPAWARRPPQPVPPAGTSPSVDDGATVPFAR